MFKNAYWPYYPKFCKELEAKILEVRLAEAFVEEKDLTDEMWADIKSFITDNIDFITKNVRVDEDRNVIAYEIISCVDYDALAYSYIALICMGEKKPIVYRREMKPVEKDDVNGDLFWSHWDFEDHGAYSLFDYSISESRMYDDITQKLFEVMVKTLSADKIDWILHNMSDEAKQIVVWCGESLIHQCTDMETRIVLIRFYNECKTEEPTLRL